MSDTLRLSEKVFGIWLDGIKQSGENHTPALCVLLGEKGQASVMCAPGVTREMAAKIAKGAAKHVSSEEAEAVTVSGQVPGAAEPRSEESGKHDLTLGPCALLYAYADFEERYAQHFEEIRDSKLSEIAFWESVERHLPEVAALCPVATQADAQDLLDLPEEQPNTPEEWADLRSRTHDSEFSYGDEGNFAQALFKFTRGARRAALAAARGESTTTTSEEASHAA